MDIADVEGKNKVVVSQSIEKSSYIISCYEVLALFAGIFTDLEQFDVNVNNERAS